MTAWVDCQLEEFTDALGSIENKGYGEAVIDVTADIDLPAIQRSLRRI